MKTVIAHSQAVRLSRLTIKFFTKDPGEIPDNYTKKGKQWTIKK